MYPPCPLGYCTRSSLSVSLFVWHPYIPHFLVRRISVLLVIVLGMIQASKTLHEHRGFKSPWKALGQVDVFRDRGLEQRYRSSTILQDTFELLDVEIQESPLWTEVGGKSALPQTLSHFNLGKS